MAWASPPTTFRGSSPGLYRAGNAVGKVAGTGLGLASVRQVVEGHGGTVAVESTLGQGSVFTLRLPLER